MNRLTYGRKLHAIVMALCLCAVSAAAQGAPRAGGSADEAAIREHVKQMETGWNTKSGEAFAKPFAEDADYVVINGMYIRGRADIAAGHQHIFDSFYKDSTLSLNVRQLRFIRPDVAVVHADASLRLPAAGQNGENRALITLVMLKGAGGWKITAFQNTQVTR